jgi:hypothetical protein
MKKCDDLLQRKQHIYIAWNRYSKIAKQAYFTRYSKMTIVEVRIGF